MAKNAYSTVALRISQICIQSTLIAGY